MYQTRSTPEVNITPTVEETVYDPRKMDHTSFELMINERQSMDDSALSRALKRKFTELEEITQRLRARLFDVTGNMTIDPDDEFENDLNTIPDEDDEFEESNIASSMSLDWLEHCHNQASSNDSSIKLGDQMNDIFEFLSPDLGTNQSTPANQPDPMKVNYVNNKMCEHFKDVSKDETAENDNRDETLQHIAESLKKSAIND